MGSRPDGPTYDHRGLPDPARAIRDSLSNPTAELAGRFVAMLTLAISAEFGTQLSEGWVPKPGLAG